MDFITVTSIGGSVWSFRKDRIEMVSKKYSFTEEEMKSIPELAGKESCAVIQLMSGNAKYFCRDSYESIMERLNQ